ncbi:LysE family translocator [Simiduia sp. 21SJ11W-1]|uniref:LysE family translocator n=1 Tax=Simiduia sp. 21SJ11W-1 TaxID=2909669 RepID=UPI0020A0B020|nr:LysE family translocator [Simiduia sp. 21SJ11W-1]UTA49078.1 LysE family translocator [Simiduia sp. 21SJ11W-1]
MLLSSWLAVAGICTLGAMSPGPSLAVVMNNTVSHGRQAGMLTALGHGLGVTGYAAATALGLAVIIASSPMIFDLIRYAGAAFLLYLAYKSFTAGKPKPQETGSQPEPDHKRKGFISGLLIAALNPKMAVFFLALFSQFIDTGASLQDKLILAATAGVIDTLWYLLVAWGLATPAVLTWLSRHQGRINRVFAVVIAALALSIVWQ